MEVDLALLAMTVRTTCEIRSNGLRLQDEITAVVHTEQFRMTM